MAGSFGATANEDDVEAIRIDAAPPDAAPEAAVLLAAHEGRLLRTVVRVLLKPPVMAVDQLGTVVAFGPAD
jgi:hypothetical protein